MVNSSLCGRVDKHRVNKDMRAFLIDIDAFQISQGSEETCVTMHGTN